MPKNNLKKLYTSIEKSISKKYIGKNFFSFLPIVKKLYCLKLGFVIYYLYICNEKYFYFSKNYMTINYQELKDQAKQQDCVNFIKRNRVKLPKNKFESFDLDSFNDERLQFETLSKQDKIKLISKNYY